MKVLGVNGIWNPDKGNRSFTDKLLIGLRLLGYKTHDVQYRKLYSLLAYRPKELRDRAEQILRVYEPGDAVVAHSAGCLLTLTAMRMGARFGTVFFFGAAVDPKVKFPEHGMKRLYNVYSPDDNALWWGRLLPFHPFGGMGLHGYAGGDTRVVDEFAPGNDHNDYANPDNLEFWVRYIDERMAPTQKRRKRRA